MEERRLLGFLERDRREGREVERSDNVRREGRATATEADWKGEVERDHEDIAGISDDTRK